MKLKPIILFSITCLLIGCNQTQDQPFDKILGEWKSVKLYGGEIENQIKEIKFTFSEDSSLTASSIMSDSTTERDTRYFNITNDSLIFIVQDKARLMKYSFSKDTLIIYDPFSKSWVYLLKQ
ncbi:unnamed protein product [Chrysoparadoxa australica]